MRTIAPWTWQAQPWNNGGGITYELARWPDTGAYDVRVSLAEVDRDGAFSRFPGYRRWSFLAGDAPIDLAVGLAAGGVTHRLAALADHVELPGEAAITAHLPGGPTRLFNVLARVPIELGRGATRHPVRFAIVLADTAEHPRFTALVDPPRAPEASLWIA